jgi:hypothetical protein
VAGKSVNPLATVLSYRAAEAIADTGFSTIRIRRDIAGGAGDSRGALRASPIAASSNAVRVAEVAAEDLRDTEARRRLAAAGDLGDLVVLRALLPLPLAPRGHSILRPSGANSSSAGGVATYLFGS